MILNQRGRWDHKRCLLGESVKQVDQACGFIGIARDFNVSVRDQVFGRHLAQVKLCPGFAWQLQPDIGLAYMISWFTRFLLSRILGFSGCRYFFRLFYSGVFVFNVR
jgi:hypothetical protein